MNTESRPTEGVPAAITTPFHLLVKLTKIYRLCEGVSFCDATAVAAKCAISELVWKCLGDQLSYDVLFDFARTTPTQLIFNVFGNTEGMGQNNAPPPVNYQIVVTDGLLALSGTRTTSPPHNTDHITDVFQTLFTEMK